MSRICFSHVLLLCLAVCTMILAASAQTVDLGNWDLSDVSSLSVVSRSIKAHVIFEVDETISRPVISVRAFGPFPVAEVTRGLVSVTGNDVTIRNWDAQGDETSAGSPLRPLSLHLSLPVLVTAALVLPQLLRGTKSNLHGFIGLLSVLALVSVFQLQPFGALAQPTASPSDAHVEVRIRIPATTTDLGNVKIELIDGSVTTASGAIFSASALDINLCISESDLTGTVNMNAVFVNTQASFCAPGSVSVSDLILGSSNVQVSLTSQNSSASLTTFGFAGTYSVTGSSAQVVGASCTPTGSTAVQNYGSCGSLAGSTSTISVVAAGPASLSATTGCASDFAGDSPMGSNVPPSPAVSTATDYHVVFNDATKFKGWMHWASTDATTDPPTITLAANTTIGGLDLRLKPWTPGVAWLSSRSTTTLPFRQNTPVTFKVRLSTSAFVNASLLLVNGLVYEPDSAWRIANWAFQDGDPKIADSHHWSGTFGGQVETFTLTPTVDSIATTNLLLRLNFTGNGSPFWANVQIEMTAPLIPPSVFQTGTSEHITQEKMSTVLDPNPRGISDCPHRASGLSHWHDASIWPGGVMPKPNSNIVIPAGRSVLISSCSLLPSSFVYNRIHIPPTSKLIFSDANINMRVRNIFVEGQLLMGSPTCRLNGKINIEFVGEKTANDDIGPGLGSKGIGVPHGGLIDVHGRQYNPTWTRIAATIWPGANVLYVQDANNWEVGQTIVVATSAMEDLDDDQNEVRTIVAIDQSGRRIQVDSPFEYYHYGGIEHQSEVGLLSRRIVFSGDDRSETSLFGGHTRVSGTGRFSGVQTYRMGQLNVLGKYPFHFHMMGDAPTSYVKDSSIWNSYFRCIAIHGTNSSQALKNVVYNAIAHCIYLEDGIEEHNVINYNLVVKVNTIGDPMRGQSQVGDERTSSADLILPADGAASGFYITNAYNTFIGNAASGGWAGFSFPNLPKPIGLSRAVPMVPQSRPTYIFRSNTAHSSGYKFDSSGCIYVGGLLEYRPTGSDTLFYSNGRFSRPTVSPKGELSWMQFNDTKTWMCGMGSSHWGDRIEIVGYESHDSGRPVQVFGEAWFSDALVNAESSSLIKYPEVPMGFQFYDTHVKSIVTRVTFRNFLPNVPAWDPMEGGQFEPFKWLDRRVLTSLIHSDYFKPQGISATRSINFDNCSPNQYVGNKNYITGSSRYFNFVDWTGDFSNTPGVAHIVADSRPWWTYDPACKVIPTWYAQHCPQGDRQVVNMDYFVPGYLTDQGDLGVSPSLDLGVTALFGPGIPDGRNSSITKNPGITGISKIGWYFYMNAGAPASFQIYPRLFPTGQWIIAAWKYPAGSTFNIIIKGVYGRPPITVTAASTFAELQSGDGRLYYFDDKHLYIKIINPYPEDAARGYTRDGVTIYRIFYAAFYDITVNCPGAASNMCPSSYVLPSVSW